MDIHLHIDQLVLEGVALSARDRRQLQATVETELGRLITENGLANHLHADLSVPLLTANSIQATTNSSPIQLGTQIAQAVYRGMKK